jgi:hypothetical protein
MHLDSCRDVNPLHSWASLRRPGKPLTGHWVHRARPWAKINLVAPAYRRGRVQPTRPLHYIVQSRDDRTAPPRHTGLRGCGLGWHKSQTSHSIPAQLCPLSSCHTLLATFCVSGKICVPCRTNRMTMSRYTGRELAVLSWCVPASAGSA